MYFDRGSWHEFQYRSTTFYTSEQYYRVPEKSGYYPFALRPAVEGGEFKKIPVPDDASVSTFGDAATITLRSAWTPPGAAEFAAGSKLALPMAELMEENFENVFALFTPTASTSLEDTTGTANYMILNVRHRTLTLPLTPKPRHS